MSVDPLLPQGARFTCQGCGKCCTRWAVTVDQQKVEALRNHDWGGEPFERNPGPGDPFRTRMINGRCFFLDAQNRCRIHTEISYDAKPDGCKAFPLHFSTIHQRSYARLSFYCPTVIENKGKRLDEQQRWVRSTFKAAGDVTRTSPITLIDDIELSSRDLDAIERSLLLFLDQTTEPMFKRLAAGSALLRRLDQTTSAHGAQGIAHTLAESDKESFATLVEEGLRDGTRAQAGPLFSLFLAQDCPPTKMQRFAHFWGVRFANLGVCQLTSHALGVKGSLRHAHRIAFDPPNPDDALLTRYLRDKITSRRYLSGELSVISGFNLIVTAYGLVSLLARLRAASASRTECAADDLSAAIQATELIAVEHTTLHHAKLFSHVVERILSTPTLPASIFARR